MVRIAHLADIHFRGLSRHAEYRKSFEEFFKQCDKFKPDHIVIAGDIVHSKTHGISPELVDILTWSFRGMASRAQTHIMLGNHDGLITNKDRQDAISPIITAINHPNLHLYKDSGVYDFADGMCFCVFSCFDEEGWKDLSPHEGKVNIAVYHGAVRGSAIESDWLIEGEVDVDIFDAYDFALLGDIHKRQYLNDAKTIAYPGSMIQQNYGESIEKGYLLWDITSPKEYTSRFIEVPNLQPFVTLDWNSIDTKKVSGGLIPMGSRVRIKHPPSVPRAEINQFKSLLMEKLGATEIVTRVLKPEQEDSVITINENVLDLRDPQVLFTLIRDYHSNISDEDIWKEIELRLRKYCEMIPKTDTARGTRWSINRIKFDNIFGYGKGNEVNFDSLAGVIGLFGANRVGKSSLAGALTYGLFNTSDRGALKNLHVINTRRNHCLAEVDVSVNSKRYRVQRQSIKRTARSGTVSASTHLNLFEIDPAGEIIKDTSGEQRRDTDRFLRHLIGDREDFFLTSFATQGEMNAFIKERATQRKAILANFLDLAVFDTLYELIKRDATEIKTLLSKVPERNWRSIIADLKNQLKEYKIKIKNIELVMTSTQSRLDGLKLELREANGEHVVTVNDIHRKENKLQIVKNRIIETSARLQAHEETYQHQIRKLEKARILERSFPLPQLEARLNDQRDIERALLTVRHNTEIEQKELQRQKGSAKILETVPCGTSFPQCKFIKRSHKDAALIDEQIGRVKETNSSLRILEQNLQNLIAENLQEKIDKYKEIFKQVNDLKLSQSGIELEMNKLKRELNDLSESEILLDDEISVMRTQVVQKTEMPEISSLHEKIYELEEELKADDASRLSLSELVGRTKTEMGHVAKEQAKYVTLLKEWKVYDLLMTATSKRGVPVHILSSRLPKINAEIAKILGTNINFAIELEAPIDSNAMNIFIDYGDSRRPIECASGMEKMLASLVIRVALINISTLPKSDILIIDEGFGTLDEVSIVVCNMLLQSLKKYFKCILVISHIEGIKDSVDNLIEIQKEGVDAKICIV